MIERSAAWLGPQLKAQLLAMLGGIMALAGCPLHGDGNHAEVRDQPAAEVPLGEMMECALAGASRFSADCVLERAGDGLLVVRDAAGGFRRFRLSADGLSLAVADGADAATGSLAGGIFAVRVGADAYRIPVTPVGARPGL